MKRRRGSSSPRRRRTVFCSQETKVTVPLRDSGGSSGNGQVTGNDAQEEGHSSMVTDVLSLVSGSGFVKVDELQLTSLMLCNECRETTVSWGLRISEHTPPRLMRLIQEPAREVSSNEAAPNRVNLPLKIHHIRYDLRGPLSDVAWPERLARLSFGNKFNQSLETLRWPPRLEVLWLGQRFNHPIEDVEWPQSLRQLRFGHNFDQPVERARWPSGLQQLIFGHQFNRPISGMKEWPRSLLLLSFGHSFNQSLEGVCLPRFLEFLEFGHEFNQSLQAVELPHSLKHLRFFHSFNQSLDGVVWPVSLRHVWLCGCFAQSVKNISWPPGLKVLALPHRFKVDDDEQHQVQLPYGCRLQLVGCG